MNIIGLIPARAGSQRVKNKNIRNLQGKPLIAYTIEAALASKLLDRVIVSTDSEEIAQIALKHGAEVPFMRPSNLATSESTELEFQNHAIDFLLTHQNYKVDLIVNLYPTCPFRKPKSIDEAIELILKNADYDSLRSISKCTEHPYKMWTMQGNRIDPFVKTTDSQEHTLSYHLLPQVFIQNACIYITKHKTIIEKKTTVGDEVLGFIMDPMEAFDINNEIDLLVAQTILNDNTYV